MLQEGLPMDAQCPSWAPSLGYMGVAAAVGLSNWGSAVSQCRRSQSTIQVWVWALAIEPENGVVSGC